MKKKIKYILIIINICIFTILAILFKTSNIANFDNKIYLLISKHQNIYLTNIFIIISFLCSTYFLISLTTLIYFLLKKDNIGIKLAINILICYILNQLLKIIFKRPRPININLIKEQGYSFPSGHAMASLSYYGFFIHLINKKKISKRTKIITTLLFSLLILLIGISRIYLGVHYASDVLAGYAISMAHLLTYTLYYKRLD